METVGWKSFRKKCRARNEIDKCRIKVSYRYNDYCEKDDCPKHKKLIAELEKAGVKE